MLNRRLLIFSALPAVLLLANPSVSLAHEGHHHGEADAAATWKCPSCGYAANTGNFCSKCGTAKPGTWTCLSCGHRGNTGKFCSNCGTAKPDPNAPATQTSSAPSRPSDNGLSLNVMRTNGTVDRYRLADMPTISFGSSRIVIGGVSYELSKVQRLEYGRSAASAKPSADKPADQQKAVYIYRRDGKFNAFGQSSIKKMSHDIADTLQVATTDSLYKIPIASIDSIGIHPFPTVYNSKVVRLAPYIPYVESVSVEKQSIKFSKNLPDEMKPKPGDILFYETFDTTFPDGFAGRVVTTDGYACSTEMVWLDDIYDRVVLFGSCSSEGGYASVTGKSQSSLPAPDDKPEQGISIDFTDLKLSVSRGPVTVSVDLDLSPDFKVCIEKRDEYDAAKIFVDVKLDASAEVSVSVGGSAELLDYTGPSFSPMAQFVIPACPVFAIGLDIHPFIKATISGSLSQSVKVSSHFAASVSYCDGDVSFKPQFKAGLDAGTPKVQAEGKVHTGFLILPSVQISGGFWKIGPAFKIGPSAAVTLDLDSGGAVNCAYDALKDSKFTVAAEGCVEAEMRVLGKLVGASSMPELPFTLASKDWYFVPEFTAPVVAPARKENVGVSITPCRDLLFPIPIGIDILKDKSQFKTYAHTPYSGEAEIMRHHFDGFQENVWYTAVPTLEIFGKHVQATPTTKFQVKENEPEVKTEDAYNVMLNSATIEGSFPEFDNAFVEYGLQYAAEGESTWHKKKNPKLDENAFFRANLSELKQNTIYRFQAYLVFDGKTYYGEEKTFLTGMAPIEFNNPGSYRFEMKYYTSKDHDQKEFQTEYECYERKGYVQNTYEKKSENGSWIPDTRINDQTQTILYYDPDFKKWIEPSYPEESYAEVVTAYRQEKKKLAEERGLPYYKDGLNMFMTYYVEEILPLLWQNRNTPEDMAKYMNRHFLGTDTVCGVKCNVYRVPALNTSEEATFWIDPKTSLVLRIECAAYHFEVTHYEINGYNFN